LPWLWPHHLILYGVKVLNYHNPLWFFAENVGGITNANNGIAFKRILSDLSKAGNHGYKLVVNKYKFEEYGIPQKRHRIIIIGIRNDQDVEFRVPSPKIVIPEQQKTAKQAISNPPIQKNVSIIPYTSFKRNI